MKKLNIVEEELTQEFLEETGLELLASRYFYFGEKEDERPDDVPKVMEHIRYVDKERERWIYPMTGGRTYLIYYSGLLVEIKIYSEKEGSLREGLYKTKVFIKSIRCLTPKEQWEMSDGSIPSIKGGVPYSDELLEQIDIEDVKDYFKQFTFSNKMKGFEETKKRRNLNDAKVIIEFDW